MFCNFKLITLLIKINKVQDNLLRPALTETFLTIFSNLILIHFLFYAAVDQVQIKYAIAPMIAAHQYQANSAILLHLPFFIIFFQYRSINKFAFILYSILNLKILLFFKKYFKFFKNYFFSSSSSLVLAIISCTILAGTSS